MKNIAVVTGASSGMGEKYVDVLCNNKKQFDEIWVIARREEKLISLREKYNEQNIKILKLDLLDENSWMIFKDTLEKEKPNIRLLVNNAGFGKTGAFENISFKDNIEMIQLNVKAFTAITYISLNYMKPGARIIQMASAAAFLPQPYFAVYAATKSYVLSFSRALGEELIKRRIKVIAVCPGPVETEFFENAGKTSLIKKAFFEKSERVVNKALRDLASGKEISIKGIYMNLFRMLAKIVPHQILIKFIKE